MFELQAPRIEPHPAGRQTECAFVCARLTPAKAEAMSTPPTTATSPRRCLRQLLGSSAMLLLPVLLLAVTLTAAGVRAEMPPNAVEEAPQRNTFNRRPAEMTIAGEVAGWSNKPRNRIHVHAGAAFPAAAGGGPRTPSTVGGAGGNSISSVDEPARSGDAGGSQQRRCTAQRFEKLANAYDDVEDLELDVPVNIGLDRRQRKRFQLHLNASTPLTIAFSQNVARKIYFNETMNLSRQLQLGKRHVVLPCALRGQYDLFVQADQLGSLKLEAHAGHPNASWPLLNRTQLLIVRNRARLRKRQMTVKWEKSHFDFHAVQYCLVVRSRKPQPSSQADFCAAVEEHMVGLAAQRGGRVGCQAGHFMDNVWGRPSERVRKIDPRYTNVVCTGNRTQQVLRGLTPNHTYHVDVFGVHTKRQNLTFHLASAAFHFKRRHAAVLPPNELKIVKLTGLHGERSYSYQVPAAPLPPQALQDAPDPPVYHHNPHTAIQLRYLIVPCGGSEVNASLLLQRHLIDTVHNIYVPTYVRVPLVQPGGRYLIRFRPSNVDEQLRADKVGLAVTTNGIFTGLPELPQNITVFELDTRCKSTTIAWYTSPETRKMSYCIIAFHAQQRNRSAVDYTNYCMDFGKRVLQHPRFHSIKCTGSESHPPWETFTIFNLTPGGNYLIYVTANLSDGQALPYQSLSVRTPQQCHNELSDSREQTSYY